MQRILLKLYIFSCFLLLRDVVYIFAAVSTASASKNGYNLTIFMRERQKRSLIFENGGQIKLSIGPSMPVPLADPITFRSLVCSINLQGGQYRLPTQATYNWEHWEDVLQRALGKMRDELAVNNARQHRDDTREFIYMFLEKILSKKMGHGRACLLRAICQNAQVGQHAGIYAEVLNVVLTPGETNFNVEYSNAYRAGKANANCLDLYDTCPLGMNILDAYLDEI